MSDAQRSSKRLRAQHKQTERRQRQDDLSKSMSKGNADVSKRLTSEQTDLLLFTRSAHSASIMNETGSKNDTERKRKTDEHTVVDVSSNKKIKSLTHDDFNEEAERIEAPDRTVNSDATEAKEPCPICLDLCIEPKTLSRCGHIFCHQCIDYYFTTVKPQCPCCSTIYGEIRGNQPLNGTMKVRKTRHILPGFENKSTGTLQIAYHFPDGIQDETHPNPGQPYHGTSRNAYLPENDEGRDILRLLIKAFELRQIFTIGQSRTTGYDNVITWNDIHHKTSYHGGPENFGYPDPTYLKRVRLELASKGIM